MGQLFADLTLNIGQSTWDSENYSYKYVPAVGNLRGAALASQYTAKFLDTINQSTTGKTIRGVVQDTGNIDRLPCNTSGAYQNLEFKVYYNTNY